MSVNQSVYGNSADWVKIGFMPETDRDKLFLMANFGDNKSSLHDGVSKGRLEYGVPIDKSLSWCGLGNESNFSRVEYWNKVYGTYTDPSTGKEIKFEKYKSENRLITNFAWIYSSDVNSLGIVKYSRTSGPTVDHGAYNRWSPEPGFFNNHATGNSNSTLRPITQIPVQNCVLVPELRVRDDLTTTTSGKTVLLWDYLNISNKVNYTNNPYITAIGIKVLTYLSNSVTKRNAYLSSSNSPSGITVLDELNYQDGEPKYYDVPGDKMGLIYSYSANYFGSSVIDRVIFGTVTQSAGAGNNSDHVQLVNAAQSGNSGIANRSQLIPVLPHPDAQWTDPITSNLNIRIYYITYYDGLKEWIRHQIACFGLFFTDDQATAENGALDSDNMLLGTLVDGVGHGDYTSGDANRDQPQWNWKTTNDSDYDAKDPPRVDPNSYNGVMDTASAPPLLGTATERYVIADTNLPKLLSKLWDVMALADPSVMAKSEYALDMFLTNNPIDSIVSLQYIPVNDMGIGDTTVNLGKYDTRISANWAKTAIVFDCGTIEISPRCGDNWIDREMKLTLYLPFCGVVDLDPETYINRKCNVEYLIDLTTGTCSAVVSFISDNGKRVIADIANGVCAIDLPVTGLQQQTLNSELFNATESTKQLKVNNSFKGFKSLMGAVSSLGSAEANPMNAINSILGVGADFYNAFQSEKIADYNLQHTIIPTKMIGASGGLTGVMATIKPTIIYSIPVDNVNYNNYGHSIGFACCESGLLSGYSGYTECTNVDLSGFSATTTEKNMIQSALAGGVYL